VLSKIENSIKEIMNNDIFSKDPTHQYKVWKDPKSNAHSPYVYCLCTQICDDGNILRCTFSARIDHYTAQVSKGVIHTCRFSSPQTNEGIQRFASKSNTCIGGSTINNDGSPPTYNFLQAELAKIVATCNLSLVSATSAQFHSFIYNLISYGQFHSTSKVEQLFPRIAREKLRRIVITTAESEHTAFIKYFKKYPYISVALDEGTTRKLMNLDFVIENSSDQAHASPRQNFNRCYKAKRNKELLIVLPKTKVNKLSIFSPFNRLIKYKMPENVYSRDLFEISTWEPPPRSRSDCDRQRCGG
jgi:hypothetical protein